MVFISDRDGQADVFRVAKTGQQEVNLTQTPTAQEETPVYSPDGTRIAFASNRSGDWDIYLMNADGSDVRRTIGHTGTDELHPFFTPDGSTLLFSSDLVAGNWDIYTAAPGSDATQWARLTTHSAADRFPSISADGATIAFRSERDGNSEIYVMDADGSHLRRLTTHSAFDGYPFMASDGSGVVFAAQRSSHTNLYEVNFGGASVLTLTTRTNWIGDTPRLSGLGTQLVYAARPSTGTYDVYVRPYASPLYKMAEQGARQMTGHCDWEAGTLAYGLSQAWRVTQNSHYWQWLRAWIDGCIPLKTQITHVNDGLLGYAALIAYEVDGDPLQLAFAQKVASYFVYTATRTADGTLVHEDDTVWDDTLLGVVPFLVKMSEISGDSAYLEEAITQTLQHAHHLQDPASGLYHHAWDESANDFLSASYWGRGNGWALLADAEILAELPITHSQRITISDIAQRHAAALRLIQSSDGRWHTVVNRPDFYLESSGTALIGHAFRQGVQAGWLSGDAYAEAARTATLRVWQQVAPDGSVGDVSDPTGPMANEEYYNLIPHGSLQLYGQGVGLLLVSPIRP